MYRLLPPRLIVALAITALLDIYVFDPLLHGSIRIDVWVIFLVYYHFFYDRNRSLAFALVLGLTRDILGQGVFGALAFSMCIGALVLMRLGSTLNREKFYVQMLAAFLVGFAVLSFDLCLESAFFKEWVWLNRFAPRVFFSSVATCLACPVILSVMQKFLGSVPRQYELFHN